MNIRRSWGHVALLALSLIGVAISIYLTSVHYENVPLVCSDRGLFNCGLVLSSKYSYVPLTKIPVSVAGLLWMSAFAVLALLGWRVWSHRRSVRVAECVLAASGLLTVLYLVYVEMVLLHTFCAWCTGLHVVIFTMLIIAVVQLQRPEVEDEYDQLEEEEPVVAVPHR